MDLKLEYGELAQNKEFVNNCENLKENLIEVQKVLDELLPLKAHYDKMCIPAQIELDLFFAFALNSLHWIHLRIQGIDPVNHPVKNELQRIKAAMIKWQEYKARDKRATVNIEAAKRFIKSGLYDRYRSGEPPNKKMHFTKQPNNDDIEINSQILAATSYQETRQCFAMFSRKELAK